MAAISSRAVSSFSRSLSSGRVFARWEVNRKDRDALVEDLHYVTTPGVTESAADIRGAGRKVLAFLQSRYPARKDTMAADRVVALAKGKRSGFIPKKRRPLNLRAGWRVNFYSDSYFGRSGAQGSTLLGFYIDHRNAENERIRTIIHSLESGSRAYDISPKQKHNLAFAIGREAAASMGHKIPARQGLGFLRDTEEYADQLLAAHGSLLETELKRIIEKGGRVKTAALGKGFDNNPTAAVSDALEALKDETSPSTSFSAKSPLKAIKKLKARINSRRFFKSAR